FASRNSVAFSVKLEVMNERLHRALHLGAARGHDLGINEMGRTLPVWRPELGNTLFHDADRLAHLFHADAVAVVTIAVLPDRDVEIQPMITATRRWTGSAANDGQSVSNARVESADGLVPALEAAFAARGVQLVAAPIDYSENLRVLVDELRAK